ncbi:MAG: 50S ribosomal protein L10 [Candidatus Pacearchaeota archaeon]
MPKKQNNIEAKVSEKKKQILRDLVNLINESNTVIIASIINISSLQFQKLKQSLKGKAIIKVVKKNLALKALEQAKAKKQGIEQLKQTIGNGSNFALLFSELDAFELAAILSENKRPSKIKPGQIAPQDIILEAGPTDLPAGPAISDLSKVKIKAGIEGGKIVIKERAVLTKQGEKVSEDVASVLAKLEIMPLSVGIEPLAAYDSKGNKVYTNIKIDKSAIIQDLKIKTNQAVALALHISYPSQETIRLLLAKANMQGNSILNLVGHSKPSQTPTAQEIPTQQTQS